MFKNETKIKIVKKDIDFIFVGRNHPIKRLDLVNYLIKILSLKIKKANFVCIVAGNTYKPFNKLISSTDLEVKYNIQNSEVLNYLQRSKFYIQLSDYEGMSMTTIEAIQNFTLLIIRQVGELRNILDDSNSIIIKGNNELHIDNALEKDFYLNTKGRLSSATTTPSSIITDIILNYYNKIKKEFKK